MGVRHRDAAARGRAVPPRVDPVRARRRAGRQLPGRRAMSDPADVFRDGRRRAPALLLARRRRRPGLVGTPLDHRLARRRRRLAVVRRGAARASPGTPAGAPRWSATTSSPCSRPSSPAVGRRPVVRLLRLRRPPRPARPTPTRRCPTPSGCGPPTCGCSTTAVERRTKLAVLARELRPITVSFTGYTGETPTAVRRRLRAGPGAPARRQQLRGQPDLPARRQAADADPAAAYLRLRELNPAPYAGFLQHDVDGARAWLLSSSPERYALVTADRTLETKPIKGTTPRGADARRGRAARRRAGHRPEVTAPRT